MHYPIFWIIYLSLVFWSAYHKWDEKREKFVEYPISTFWYFAVASLILIVFYPKTLGYFNFEPVGIIFLILVLLLTSALYKILKKLFVGPAHHPWTFFEYYKILDTKFILPKLSEIIFQQTFFISIFLISVQSFSFKMAILVVVIAFVLAHLNLFLFRSKSEALFYLIFSSIGAPMFLILILLTGSIWFSVGFHMLFYTFLSSFAWICTKVKY